MTDTDRVRQGCQRHASTLKKRNGPYAGKRRCTNTKMEAKQTVMAYEPVSYTSTAGRNSLTDDETRGRNTEDK